MIDTPTKERLCAEDPKSAELLKPLLVGDDAERWHQELQGLWIIYIPKSRFDINDYPAIRDWLLPFKEALEKRATKQEWFELQQAQEAYRTDFEGSKIIYPEMSQGRKFSFHPGPLYLNNKAFYLGTSDSFLLALLNSCSIWFVLRGLAAALKGGEWRLELRKIYIEQLPIPTASEAQKQALADLAEACQSLAQERLKRQENFRRRIGDLCPPERQESHGAKLSNKLKNWWEFADFTEFQKEIKKVFKSNILLSERNDWQDWFEQDRETINTLTAEITANEAKINALVYELFDLTSDEITLLEANI